MERDNPACPRCGSPMSCEKNPARTGGFLCVCGHVVEPSTRSLAFGHLDEPPCGIFRQIELRDAAGDLVCEFKTGDTVIHRPTGETLTVAYVDALTDRVCPCGWPLSFVATEDCELRSEASEEERLDLLHEMAAITGDPRGRYARRALMRGEKQEASR